MHFRYFLNSSYIYDSFFHSSNNVTYNTNITCTSNITYMQYHIIT